MGHLQYPLKVFISYSHQDKLLKEHLIKHLNSMIRQKYIELWHDDMMLPGSSIDDDIFRAMSQCDIALLLISSDYLASDYFYSSEMEAFMNSRKNGKIVIPVMLRPVDLKGTPFDGLKSLPEDRKAVSSYKDQDDAMQSIASGIRRVVENAYQKSIPGMNNAPLKGNHSQNTPHPSSHVNYGFEFQGNQINGGFFKIEQ